MTTHNRQNIAKLMNLSIIIFCSPKVEPVKVQWLKHRNDKAV